MRARDKEKNEWKCGKGKKIKKQKDKGNGRK